MYEVFDLIWMLHLPFRSPHGQGTTQPSAVFAKFTRKNPFHCFWLYGMCGAHSSHHTTIPFRKCLFGNKIFFASNIVAYSENVRMRYRKKNNIEEFWFSPLQNKANELINLNDKSSCNLAHLPHWSAACACMMGFANMPYIKFNVFANKLHRTI